MLTNLAGAYLRAANCTEALLIGANLDGAVLTNAIFAGANLQHIQASLGTFTDVSPEGWRDIILDTPTAERLGLLNR